MNKKRMYMTTGELARIMGITKETLFHYDETDCSDLLSLRQTDTVIMKSDKWNC